MLEKRYSIEVQTMGLITSVQGFCSGHVVAERANCLLRSLHREHSATALSIGRTRSRS